MKQIATFRQKDIFLEKQDDSEGIVFEDRPTVKAIVFDRESKIAIVGTNANDYYLLPGGGINHGENIEEAVVRECKEEIGCEVKIRKSLGIIDDYRNRDAKHCISYCFVCDLIGEKGTPQLTDEEKKNGLHVIWVKKEKAMKIFEDQNEKLSVGKVNFYNTAFNIKRDYYFLEAYMKESK